MWLVEAWALVKSIWWKESLLWSTGEVSTLHISVATVISGHVSTVEVVVGGSTEAIHLCLSLCFFSFFFFFIFLAFFKRKLKKEKILSSVKRYLIFF